MIIHLSLKTDEFEVSMNYYIKIIIIIIIIIIIYLYLLNNHAYEIAHRMRIR